ncbi:Uncharacterised protein [Mycobacteroides abscessus subsp. abscessus]|nr:Uncharacterised protein [Mycobacteroides abscessus subsp. abscessus]
MSCCADQRAKGCVPAQNNSMPMDCTIGRTVAKVACKSCIASPTVPQIPVTTSMVLRSSSL